jgi:Na+/phosphate symporter
MLPMLVVAFYYMVRCMVSTRTLFIARFAHALCVAASAVTAAVAHAVVAASLMPNAVLQFVCLALSTLFVMLQLCSTDRKLLLLLPLNCR